MPIHINNSLTRSKEELIPINKNRVNIYTCGVTVYDESHIGHARSLYVFDVMRRYLKYRGYDVAFVRNITDIDDKIINRAKELNLDWQELVNKYIDSYYSDLAALGIERADIEPRATQNIEGMIGAIQKLIEKGYAYRTQTGVYFSVRKFKDYGKLSGQSIEQIISGSRKNPDETKADALDFALWKASKPDEPFWPSPWGPGRPGWHIECSVMSQKYLNADTLDIHAGGRDLIFPHHENEIAQSEALTGKPFAKYWIHHGLLTINGQKMAKSLGNFITIKDFLAKHKDPDILKLFFLSAHYSHPIDYNEEKMEEHRKQKKSFDIFFDKINNWKKIEKNLSSDKEKTKVDIICNEFMRAMDDDFNTSEALGSLFMLMDTASSFISSDKGEVFQYAALKLKEFFGIFGLNPKSKQELPEDMIKMTEERDRARKAGNFKKADEIRKEIKTKFGYIITDTGASGTSYRP